MKNGISASRYVRIQNIIPDHRGRHIYFPGRGLGPGPSHGLDLGGSARLRLASARLGHDIEMCSGITVLHHRGKVYIFLGASGLLGSARLGSASARLDSALARRLRSSQNKRPPGGTRFSFVKSRNIFWILTFKGKAPLCQARFHLSAP